MAANKIRKSARDEDCCLQIHPYCNGNPETVVLCHLNSDGKGWAIKSPDWFGVYGCSDCHDVIDGRRQTELDEAELLKCQMRGLYRTWQRLIEKGLINAT